MSLLARLDLRQRLYGVALTITLALAGLATLAWVELHEIARVARTTGSERVPQLQRVAAMELNVTRVSLQVRHAILSRTPDELAATLADIGERRKAIAQGMADYEAALVSEDSRKRFAAVAPQLAAFWKVGEANLALIQSGKKDEAFDFLVRNTIPARNALLTSLADSVKYQEAGLGQDLGAVVAEAELTLKALIAVALVIAVLMALSAHHVSARVRHRVALARQVADRVRDGDLTQPAVDNARDELSPLLTAMNQMQERLTTVVGSVRHNAESVASASAQIAQGNQDLSSRTEQQASALQQTAATMDELGATVRTNSDAARQANQLALGASGVAVKGGEVVGQVVETMRGITDSSRRIAEIIGVIDGIAFQTNILALNAAVEAARAGEQGRGFAVVAGEVRSLAQRSAEAAREIKGLIGASVERVEQGSSLVSEAGQTMSEIVGAVKRVSDIVGEISSASLEQSTGVNQVGEAVTRMDQSTQQNAALVEESAAAAESLRQQAQQLVQAVAVFKLA